MYLLPRCKPYISSLNAVIMKNLNLLFIGLTALLTSCNLYPGSNVRTDQLDVVVTHYDQNTDFDLLTTYALATQVKPVSANPNDPPSFNKPVWFDDLVKQTIESNLAAYGWIKVDSASNPDMAIDLAYTITLNTNVYGSYPGYGWGYPGYGWGYPWFSYSTVSRYEVGSLFFVGLDLNNVDTTNQVIPAMWHALIQGPLTYSPDDQQERLVRDINIAFEQSPYLNVNP
jgi:hypothetical protein